VRTAAKRDANEADIVQGLARCGWFARRLSDPDWPDLFIAKGGRRELVEVKEEGETFTEGQNIVAKVLDAFGVHVYIAHTVEQLLKDLGETK
jgi:hypothetical protein